MAKVTFIKKARKDYPNFGIKKGDSYYTWGLMYGPRMSRVFKSLTNPKPSQLTSSDFLQQIYSIQEQIQEAVFNNAEGLEAFVEEILGELENLQDETQEKLDNMPEGLQQGHIGELLQERIDALDAFKSEIESIDLDFEFDKEEPEEPEEPEKGEGESEEDFKIRYKEWETEQADYASDYQEWENNKEEAEKEFTQERLEELQGLDSGL